jgi:catechol-2,3-dioxygenase
MLGDCPIDVMLLATDLDATREFYAGRLGLEVLIATDDFLTFGCGGDSRLVVTKSNTGTREPQTKASWRVRDIAAEVAELRSRGVEVAEIADVGFALAAWFSDPAGNSLGLLQFKDAERA